MLTKATPNDQFRESVRNIVDRKKRGVLSNPWEWCLSLGFKLLTITIS